MTSFSSFKFHFRITVFCKFEFSFLCTQQDGADASNPHKLNDFEGCVRQTVISFTELKNFRFSLLYTRLFGDKKELTSSPRTFFETEITSSTGHFYFIAKEVES